MIANKHTELRLVSNLNDLLEDSKTKQDINEKIHKHTFEYMMTYVSDNDLEDKNIYDKLEELSNGYQTHCYKIAKEIKDEILEENGEEIDTYYDSNDERGYYSDTEKRQVKKEIYLNPDKFTQQFKDNLEEDICKLVINNFFKELDNIVKVFEYRKKIDNLRKKDRKSILEENKDEIKFLINARINKAFEFYLNKANGNAKLVLDNFSLVQEIIDDIFDDVIDKVKKSIDDNITKSDIESMFNKQLKVFIKEQRGLIAAREYTPTQVQQVQTTTFTIPKSVQAYAIASILEDITK